MSALLGNGLPREELQQGRRAAARLLRGARDLCHCISALMHCPGSAGKQAAQLGRSGLKPPRRSSWLQVSGTHLVDRYHLARLPVPVGLRPEDAHLQAGRTVSQTTAADCSVLVTASAEFCSDAAPSPQLPAAMQASCRTLIALLLPQHWTPVVQRQHQLVIQQPHSCTSVEGMADGVLGWTRQTHIFAAGGAEGLLPLLVAGLCAGRLCLLALNGLLALRGQPTARRVEIW